MDEHSMSSLTTTLYFWLAFAHIDWTALTTHEHCLSVLASRSKGEPGYSIIIIIVNSLFAAMSIESA